MIVGDRHVGAHADPGAQETNGENEKRKAVTGHNFSRTIRG